MIQPAGETNSSRNSRMPSWKHVERETGRIDPDDRDPEKSYPRYRPTRVSPERLAGRLALNGFDVCATIRDHVTNSVDVILRPRNLPGLFEILHVSAGIDGEHVAPCLYAAIAPGGYNLAGLSVGGLVPASSYGEARDTPDGGVLIKTSEEARDLERRLADALPRLEAELCAGEGTAFRKATASARAAGEHYLARLQPGSDLQKALARLRSQAGDDEWTLAQQFTRICVRSFGLEEDRLIFDIAGLCHVLFAEAAARPFPDFKDYRNRKSTNRQQQEVIWRVDYVASRLAREPGWPEDDPLIPARADPNEPLVPYPSPEPQSVSELFAAYAASRRLTCRCGQPLVYESHAVVRTNDPPSLLVTARCTAGHVDTIEVGWKS